jgi:opacity protein-like surface antigen
MRKILAAAAIACAASAPAFSATVYTENFNDFGSFAGYFLGDSYTDYMNSAKAFALRPAHGHSFTGDAWYITNDDHSNGAVLLNETGGGGRASTTITGLTAGNHYTLSFDFYSDTAGQNLPFGLSVLIDDSQILGQTDSVMGRGYYANIGAPRLSVDFVATGSSVELAFEQASPLGSSASPLIDNIEIKDAAAVPEPASAALVFAGLGAMGMLRRRRQA